MKLKVLALAGLVLAGMAGQLEAGFIAESDVFNNWSRQADFITNANSANWALSGTTIRVTNNGSGALISDFTQTADFSFSTSIQANGDNDLMGIVFGWQDQNNTYGLTWGGGGVGSQLNGIHLFREVAGVRTSLASLGGNWASNAVYGFSVARNGGNLSVAITSTQNNTTLFSQVVSDSTFLTGMVGFDVYSQAATFSFGNTQFSQVSDVPEPTSIAMWGLGALGLTFARRKRRQIVLAGC